MKTHLYALWHNLSKAFRVSTFLFTECHEILFYIFFLQTMSNYAKKHKKSVLIISHSRFTGSYSTHFIRATLWFFLRCKMVSLSNTEQGLNTLGCMVNILNITWRNRDTLFWTFQAPIRLFRPLFGFFCFRPNVIKFGIFTFG